MNDEPEINQPTEDLDDKLSDEALDRPYGGTRSSCGATFTACPSRVVLPE